MDTIKILFEWIEKKWQSPVGLLLSLIAAVILGSQIFDIFNITGVFKTILLIILLFAIFISWYLNNYPRKTKKGKIGFIFALYCSDEEENKKIQEDFIDRIKINTKRGSIGKIFQFIEVPPQISKKIESFDDAQKIRIKYRGLFILYGRVRNRPINGDPYHFIELKGIVGHRPVPEVVQKHLANEFGELLPSELRINQENDVFSFIFSSEFIETSTKYIIGIAAMISGDLNLAEKLFLEVSSEIINKDKKLPIYEKINRRIPIRLSEVWLNKASVLYNEWKITHNENLVESIGANLELIGENQRNNQIFGVLYSIFLFINNRDIEGAILSLNKYCDVKEFNWHMNYSFLMAYKGELSDVKRHFNIAQLHATVPSTVADTEEFAKWVLEEEPSKYTLHYYLGFINWMIKGDLSLAIDDFSLFIENANKDTFDQEIQYCISRIKLLEIELKNS